ncbi:MAG: hypothetical protein F6K48_20995, partial [Okeania sp. SIO3H1]|nr:hypothetical protein [Okeania sp. SIO3H1]
MNYPLPGNQIQNQPSSSSRDNITGQEQQNDNSENWEICLSQFKKKHGNCYFNWLLQLFGIQSYDDPHNQHDKNQNPEQEKQQINALENAIKSPQKFLETFHSLYTTLVKLTNSNEELQEENNALENKNNSSLKKRNKQLKEQV